MDNMTEREAAARRALVMLRTPLLLMTRPEREDVRALCELHGLTASDLIDVACSLLREGGERRTRRGGDR